MNGLTHKLPFLSSTAKLKFVGDLDRTSFSLAYSVFHTFYGSAISIAAWEGVSGVV